MRALSEDRLTQEISHSFPARQRFDTTLLATLETAVWQVSHMILNRKCSRVDDACQSVEPSMASAMLTAYSKPSIGPITSVHAELSIRRPSMLPTRHVSMTMAVDGLLRKQDFDPV